MTLSDSDKLNNLVFQVRASAPVVFQADDWENEMKKRFPEYVHSHSTDTGGWFEIRWAEGSGDSWFTYSVSDAGDTYLRVGNSKGVWQTEPFRLLAISFTNWQTEPFRL